MRDGSAWSRACLRGGAAAAAVTVLLAAAPLASAGTPASGQELYDQTFSGGSVPPGDLISGGAGGNVPCLTAGNPQAASSVAACPAAARDPAGRGVLRLTGNRRNESGYVLYTQPLPTADGLRVAFDMYQYHTTSRNGADGIGFVLVDGSQSPRRSGDFGGFLGYKGLVGAYLGIGLDEFGNFANSALWRSGSDGRIPNSIVIRGAQAAGYPYLRGVVAAYPLADDRARTREAAMRHVVIELSTSGVVTVTISYGSRQVTEISGLNLNDTSRQPQLPPTVKFGFTSATGDDTAIHEISELSISALPPDLNTRITASGTFEEGGTGTLTTTVSDAASAGPTTGPVTVTEVIPDGLTPQTATGNGWTCGIAGQEVSCTRPDVLTAGISFPPITVTTAVAADAPRTVVVPASATTAGQSPPAGGDASVQIPIMPGPSLSDALTTAGQFPAAGTGSYLLTVRNSATAGPTLRAVTQTFNVPDAQIPLAAAGDGWTCAVNKQQVTCITLATLRPGRTYPPITVTVQNQPRTVKPAAQVSTANDTGEPGETTAPVTIPLTSGP
jgi:hypothetical protein